MTLLRAIISACLDAIFPVPQAEIEALSLNPEEAFRHLPRAKQFPIAEACSVFAYKDERVTRLVWSLKYKKSARAALIGGFALSRILKLFSGAAGTILVIPMPITKKRRRERGFNQCELLTDVIKTFDQDDRLIIAKNLLIRVHHTSRQTLKDRRSRLESIKEIFEVNEKVSNKLSEADQDIKKRLLIVIDDVVTTGSTMKDALETLRKAGFPNSFGLSLAH